jgi:hypothetical protein
MTNERKEAIKTEAKRRIDEWIKHSTFNEMAFGGSIIRFDMSLGLRGGYPFGDKPQWMKGKKFNNFVTDKEFLSKEYDCIILELFRLERSANIRRCIVARRKLELN